MVKTFSEWFDEQDWSTQMYFAGCSSFIQGVDEKGEKAHGSRVVKYQVKINCLPEHNKDNFFSTYDRASKSWKDQLAVQLLYASRLKTVNMLSDSEYYAIIRKGVDTFGLDEIQNYLIAKDFREALKQAAIYKWNEKLIACICCADDPENPDWSLLVSEKEEDNYFEYKWFKFIPFDQALNLVRKDLSLLEKLAQFIRDEQDKEVKDNHLKQVRELIFSKDGLSVDDREKALFYIYRNRSINDFIREILPIDIRYGKLISKFYSYKHYSEKAIVEEMNRIIDLRKRDAGTEEERARPDWYESIESSKPRYGKKIRQMAMLYRACVTKSYPKSKTSIIGDALCLLKMYDFSWSQVFDATYGHSDC